MRPRLTRAGIGCVCPFPRLACRTASTPVQVTVKILFLTLIALVIPLFFLLIFLLSTYNRLATLRRRCLTTALNEAESSDATASLAQRKQAIEAYNAARTTFPTSVVATLFGFQPEPASETTAKTR